MSCYEDIKKEELYDYYVLHDNTRTATAAHFNITTHRLDRLPALFDVKKAVAKIWGSGSKKYLWCKDDFQSSQNHS